ncbi:helix-turn-helix domain-containing protein [Haloglycomyces albus]|uniref:helix-turn-helix domain-containing protein n=1 Tax=Haloglycomyces albus TaxID=526067 RepID=UPI0009FEAFFD
MYPPESDNRLPQEFLSKIHEIRNSALDLTSRQKQVLLLVSQGLSDRQIAHRLGLTLNTVQNYNRDIRTRLGVQSRAVLAIVGYVASDSGQCDRYST